MLDSSFRGLGSSPGQVIVLSSCTRHLTLPKPLSLPRSTNGYGQTAMDILPNAGVRRDERETFNGLAPYLGRKESRNFCNCFMSLYWCWIPLQLIQIVTNFRNGHTGQLSFIMVLLLTLGAVARIFTTIQETGDKVMLVTFLVSVTLNATLTFQVLYYWNVKPDLKKKEA